MLNGLLIPAREHLAQIERIQYLDWLCFKFHTLSQLMITMRNTKFNIIAIASALAKYVRAKLLIAVEG
jgi:hypothetical protein